MKKAVIFSMDEDSEEIRSLLKTLEITIVREFVQKRIHSHREGFLGPGKIEEIFKEIEKIDIDLIVVNGVLKPSQHHFLEMKFQKECIDRTGVILRIFTDHAHTPEAIAQVTLAKLRYELPFLREWIHKAKSGDRPGFLAGGAYATDVYFEHAKTHARRIEESLQGLSKQREITRAKRREKGFSLVSLAGYTNAGKSALMNRLCDADVVVDDRLFSTLSTTTRQIKGVKGNILMSDTVGFIRDLPPDLIDAFNSTLEEIFYADLILLVFDVSESAETIKSKLSTSMKILLPKIENRLLLVVGNKVDLVSPKLRPKALSLVEPIARPYDIVLVSSVTGEGLDVLRDKIVRIQGRSFVIEARMPITDETYGLLSRLRSNAEVTMRVASHDARVIVKCKPEDSEKVIGWLTKVGGVKVIVNPGSTEVDADKKSSSTGSEGGPLI